MRLPGVAACSDPGVVFVQIVHASRAPRAHHSHAPPLVCMCPPPAWSRVVLREVGVELERRVRDRADPARQHARARPRGAHAPATPSIESGHSLIRGVGGPNVCHWACGHSAGHFSDDKQAQEDTCQAKADEKPADSVERQSGGGVSLASSSHA